MAVFYLTRKLCPRCGKPMTAVPDDIAQGKQRYVCTVCDSDPLHDPRCASGGESPLKPPARQRTMWAQGSRGVRAKADAPSGVIS